MRPSILLAISRTTPYLHLKMSTPSTIPSATAQVQKKADISTNTNASQPSTFDLNIESVNINTASGADLNAQQKVLVGSILDLFKGKPTLKKLQLWTVSVISHPKGRKEKHTHEDEFSDVKNLNKTGRRNIPRPPHKRPRKKAILSTVVRPSSRLFQHRTSCSNPHAYKRKPR